MLRLRGIVAALAAAGIGVGALACGAVSGNASGYNPSDSGAEPDSGVGFDASSDSGPVLSDSATGVDAGADSSAVETGAEFVHASPNLGDMRLCWQVGDGGFASAPPFPTGAPAPASNYPALPVGGAVPLPDASSLLGGDLTIVAISAAWLYANEDTDASSADCATLMGSGSGSLQSKFEGSYSFTVPAGTVVAGATDVIALAGCPPNDVNGSVARCGAGYTSATGNLHVDVLPLYQVTQSDAGQLPVQVGQLSPALAQLAGNSGVVVSFGAQGATSPVATLGGEGAFAPPNAAYLNVGTNPTNYGTLGFGVDVVGVDGGPGHLWMSLEQSLELVGPMMNPAVYYTQVDTYVVAVVGDPNGAHAFAPDASFDGTGLHILVFPL